MADVRGPSDTKGFPVDSMLGPLIRVGYENRLNTVIPFNTLITYSTKAAANCLSVKKGQATGQQSNALVDEDYGVSLWQTPCFNTD